MIIWIASYPRSGNTFFCTLLGEVYGVKPHDIYWFQNPPFYVPVDQDLGFPFDAPPPYEEMIQSDKVHFVKTHNMPEEDFPAIYLVRDGRDALLSHAHYVLNYDLRIPADEQPNMFLEVLQALIETEDWFGGWGSNVLAWTSRTTTTAIVKFEDLIQSPVDCLRRSLMTVGYMPQELDSISIPTFEQLHQSFPQFFRQGRVGSWRKELPKDLHELFWEWHGEAMVKMGYGEDPVLRQSVSSSSSHPAARVVRSNALVRLRKQIHASDADREARQMVIDDLKQHLEASEADRAARLEVINDLKQHLEASEADRAARLEVINDLKQHLEASEADRAARLEVINDLKRRLDAIGAGRATRRSPSDDLKQRLDASEAERLASEKVIGELRQQIDANWANQRASQAVIEDLKQRLEASEADRAARQDVIDSLLLQIDELMLQLRNRQSGN